MARRLQTALLAYAGLEAQVTVQPCRVKDAATYYSARGADGEVNPNSRYLSITHKCLGDWRACYASIARLSQRSSGGSRTAPARRTEALRGRWAEGWAASRCFGWAGFQMLRFAQHDSSMSDFAGLRLGGILDASRWHDRLI